MSRSAAANLRGGRSRLCENSRPLADSDNVASVKCMLMRTAKRIVAFLVSGCAPEKSFPSGNARVTNQVWALPRALATGVSAPVGLPFRSQAQQRVRKARPFEQLLS